MTLVDLFVKGGPVMVPLLLCSVLALAVTLERLWFLYCTRDDGEALIDEVKLALRHGKVLEAMQLVKRGRGPVSAVLTAAIAACDRPKDEIRERAEAVGRQEVFRMERRLNVLDAIVTLAPLLGLLGTVTGIIRSFRILALAQGVDQPAALSSGIAEALITTAAGLVIAIVSYAAYSWFSSLIDRRVHEMNQRVSELLDILEMPMAGGER